MQNTERETTETLGDQAAGWRPGEAISRAASSIPVGVQLAMMYDKPDPTLADAHRVTHDATACLKIAQATPEERATLKDKMLEATCQSVITVKRRKLS